MNTVKDFTVGQRVTTDLGEGAVSKIGRVYVYVDIDGGKTEKLTPADLREPTTTGTIPVAEAIAAAIPQPVVATSDEAHVPVDYLPLMASGSGKSDITDVAGLLDNAAPTGGRPPMRIKGKRADADHRRSARKAQRRSRRANRTR